ncbi:MAG: FAD binding domain-containing protein [Spirochaetaceae bacterium]|nr:FAD binding domain-containing protein [Spirochaetaceae bacterium]
MEAESERKKTTLKVNGKWHSTSAPYGNPLLDFLRTELGLKGTKEGCREGDCGACAVLVGRPIKDLGEASGDAQGVVRYRAVPSCLLALGDVDCCHVITIEGLVEGAPDGLTPVMRAFLEENASQCGFCTPGFIIALSSWLAGPGKPDLAGAMKAIDGNLCRCTGYGAIRRAAERLAKEFGGLPEGSGERLKALVERQVLPESVLGFAEERRRRCEAGGSSDGGPAKAYNRRGLAIGGGTDYYVRNPEPEADFSPALLSKQPDLAGISEVQDEGKNWVEAGAAITASDFFASPLVRRAIPGIENFETEFASTLIRNLATIGGNIANASPVGDLTCMLMGAGAVLVLGKPGSTSPGWAAAANTATRKLPIEKFFLGYKKTDLQDGEIIRAIRLPEDRPFFSFEKIAKRRQLDIASVNTAISFIVADGYFTQVRISAGGIAPTPVLLKGAASAMEGASRNRGAAGLAVLARKVATTAMDEIKPISDVRGSAEYRRQMLGKLIIAHFLRFFEDEGIGKELFP